MPFNPRLSALALSAGAALLLSACAVPHTGSTPQATAMTQLRATSIDQPLAAKPVAGTLRFAQTGGTVTVTGEVSNLKPNALHGFHVHERGDCSAPDASSAGSHYNPTGTPHGAHGVGAHHVGDMPQLKADATGVAKVQFTSQSLTLDGPHSIVGKSVIVHRDPDDVNAQPVGNAGPRLACGVIAKGG